MMNGKTIAAMGALTAGRAGVQMSRPGDAATGYRRGDIERDGNAFLGAWQSAPELGSRPLENVEVQGYQVRFDTDQLRFVGQVSGDTLSGKVTEKSADAPVGEFVVTHEESHNPASEWSPAFIP